MNRQRLFTSVGAVTLTALAGAAAAAANLGILRSAPIPHVGELAPVSGGQPAVGTSGSRPPGTSSPARVAPATVSTSVSRTTPTTRDRDDD
jgi:hypothetical protein